MQVGKLRVVDIALQRLARAPLDQDHHVARLDLADAGLAELAERNDAPTVRLHFFRRALRVCEVFVAIGNIEQVQRVERIAHRSSPPRTPPPASSQSGFSLPRKS